MNKKLAYTIITISFLVILGYLFFNQNGFLKEIKANNEISSIENYIDSMNVKIRQLNKENNLLQNSKTKIEEVAREKYNLRGKNEKVLDIEIK